MNRNVMAVALALAAAAAPPAAAGAPGDEAACRGAAESLGRELAAERERLTPVGHKQIGEWLAIGVEQCGYDLGRAGRTLQVVREMLDNSRPDAAGR